MNLRRILLVTLICAAATIAIFLLATGAHAASSLTVHAGAGIRPPLDELGKRFEKKTGTRVEYNYKGSGCLLADICFSKRGDVYIPGEIYYVEQGRERGFIEASRIVAQMSTVVIVQKNNPKNIGVLKDLTRSGLRVGLADPEKVAIGRAANQSLVRAGVLKAVEKNVVMRALNVVELGIGVKLEHLDAAIVWDATAHLFKGDVEMLRLPDEWRVDSPIPVGVLKFSKQPSVAGQFMEFLASEEAAKVFRAHGYSVPPQKPTAVAKS
jgi:molybdate transport system substrate-binding protein